METASLNTSFIKALEHDIAPNINHLRKLSKELASVADLIKSAYQHDPRTRIFFHADDVRPMMGYEHINELPDSIEVDDDTELFHGVFWTVSINEEAGQLQFDYSNNHDYDREETVLFEMSDKGCQSLIAHFTENLIGFLPPSIKIACFEEHARRTGQRVLGL